jgi:membrane-bound metal-dependent hydrolase YbcI (DUF457 family)
VDPVTHAASGALLARLFKLPAAGWGVLAGVILATLPDLDYVLVFWDRLAYLRHHRGVTHSIWAVPLFAWLGAAAGRWRGGRAWFKPLFWLGIAAMTTHLILDLATSFGTQIFSPISNRRYTLDWVFIIDPYLTGLLLLGCLAGWVGRRYARAAAAACLALAGAYLLLCGWCHSQALGLARQMAAEPAGAAAAAPWARGPLWDLTYFPYAPGAQVAAALPQPLSCRRWQLLAAEPGQVRQAMVELPWAALLGRMPEAHFAAHLAPAAPGSWPGHYPPPGRIAVHTWQAAASNPLTLDAAARKILDNYLDFARFPLLLRAEWVGPDSRGVNSLTGESPGTELRLEWRDLRFSLPGRRLPFALHLNLDPQGRLLPGSGLSR